MADTNWQPGDPVYPPQPSVSALAEALDVPAEVLEMDALNDWDAARWQPDDPTPTTGGPVEYYEFPKGCRCYIREDVEYGDVLIRPPGGCPVHSCTCLSLDDKHAVTCRTVALSQPNAMVCPNGDVFYADNPGDAADFARDHRAIPLHPAAFFAMFPELLGAGRG